MGLRLSIITPASPLVETEVDSVVAPGREGEFGVLPGHELFLAPLRPGVLRYTAGGQEQSVAVSGGFAEVTQEGVTVLAPAAATPDQVDRGEAQREFASAENAQAELGHTAPPDEIAAVQERLEIARARLALVS